MRPKSRTAWSWSGSPTADRRRRPTCAPATSCSRSAGKDVRDLAGFFRRIWAQGQAGVEVPLTIYRDGETMEMRVKSSERNRFLKGSEPALRFLAKQAPATPRDKSDNAA